MKFVIFGVIAFVVGIGGSTGALVLTAPKLAPGSDSLVAAHLDSLAKHGASGAPGEAAPAGEHAATPAAVPAVAAEGTPAAPEGTATEPLASEGATHGTEATNASHAPVMDPVRVSPAAAAAAAAAARMRLQEPDGETFKQVGSILMNMKPAEATKIMSYLNDTQVEGLLRSMSPRNAATVLSQFPAERAAALSRRLLVPAPKEERP